MDSAIVSKSAASTSSGRKRKATRPIATRRIAPSNPGRILRPRIARTRRAMAAPIESPSTSFPARIDVSAGEVVRTRARTKWVYLFANGKAEGNEKMRDLLGGRGAGLAEMTNAKPPVPPGFTITTAACNAYFAAKKKLPPGLWDQVEKSLATVEKAAKKKLGDPKDPLLVSVRSRAAMSMPGMMDTVLNLGLNDESRKGLAKLTKNERFAWDAYRRFLSMVGRIVLGIDAAQFEHAPEARKKAARVKSDPELSPKQLAALVDEYKAVVPGEAGKPFPTEPQEQLRLAIEAAVGPGVGQRAKDYRKQFKISDDLGPEIG